MDFTFAAAGVALLLLAGMLGCLELGRRAGLRRLARHPDAGDGGGGAMDAAVHALFGLLIAFTFSGAAGRFDSRRELILQEANAVGTAWLRVDLLPSAAQAELRPLYRRYVEARLAVYRDVSNMAATRSELERAAALQGEIWKVSMSAAIAYGNPAVISLVGQSLNEMIDITTSRVAATRMHPPLAVFLLLFGMGLASSLVAGYTQAGGRRRSRLHALVYASALAASIYVILDMEFPRLGLIQVDAFDQLLVDVLASMKQAP